jgi:hypothetical protein
MKNKIKGSCEFSDVTTIELNDVFPNPTEVQINEWNKWYGEKELNDELYGDYVKVVRNHIINQILNVESVYKEPRWSNE